MTHWAGAGVLTLAAILAISSLQPIREPMSESNPAHLTLNLEVDLNVSGKAAWSAISNPRQLSNWFPLEARVVPGLGGSVTFSWGEDAEGTQPIEAWEEGHRILLGRWSPQSEERTEYTLEDRDGVTRLHVEQTGITSQGHLEALRRGWGYFLWNLQHYLHHHTGVTRRMVWARRGFTGDPGLTWDRLIESQEGLDLRADPGEAQGVGTSYRIHLGPDLDLSGRLRSVERPYTLSGTLDELNHGLLFVEFEGQNPAGFHVGVWISTYGAEPAAVMAAQSALDRLMAPMS